MSGWTTEYIAGRPRIAVDRMGAGPLALFMHGIGGNRTNWHDQLPVFAPDFNAVAWDARGYGLSDDYEGALDFADFSIDVARVLDHFGADKAHLIGLSMGGRIAQDFYERHRDRVATLVLVDTFPGHDDVFREDQREEFLRLRKKPLLEGKALRDMAPDVAKALIGTKAAPDKFQRLIDSMSVLHKESYIKTLEATTRYEGVADLESFAVPTLLVFGSDDRLTTPELGRKMHARIPGSELTILEDAGHLSNIEKPEEFNAAVLEFLRDRRELAA